jgi:hypothetical protein
LPEFKFLLGFLLVIYSGTYHWMTLGFIFITMVQMRKKW